MSLLNLRISSTETSAKSGISNKSGKPYAFKQQTAFVEINDETRKIDVTLADGEPPYPVGKYTLDVLDYVVVGRFGFEFDRFKPLKLVPASVSAIPRAA
ncbi:MAG: single-stranded DNA-binding protein [Paludibacter sp.]|nr:single-stranded DNA-binding protein [Paludibacter sp.]